ncbi:hypothetical protein CVV26_01430 [Candidatus Kuenenbacteria bacterium HGW-Kuenenbacteria-1]|uniref:Uncharacterized protein n=1 Tax=Candidatus Kuenenbacteria bacterium HGW-Kuenenbacteria-1 TaxID=2013812 RepID=A0A2N1UNQ6_9BACT|nr:MAG: hypothetical protein CVV26_01430 [Candidatus Kuenenbacteria bacterium HGW-Kuenenbacteria-1]
MIQTSQDLLFIVLAFCALWITILLCWGLFYFIAMLRDTYKITKNVNRKIEAFGELIEALKNRVTSMGAFLTLFSHGFSALIDHIKEKKEQEKEDKKIKIKVKNTNKNQ